MSLREKMNQNPGTTAAVVGAIIVLAIVVIIWQMVGGPKSGAPPLQTKAYFSVDDGKTWFVDDISKIPPFDYNGKKAYRARVFEGPDGKKFVGYLESYDEKERKQIEAAMQRGVPASQAMYAFPELVKKPGGTKWLKQTSTSSKQLEDVTRPKTPDGKTEGIKMVRPSDNET